MNPKLPRTIWADHDPEYPPHLRWSFYRSKADQRSNRPDLEAIELRVTRVRKKSTRTRS